MSIPSDYNKENEAASTLKLEDTLEARSSPTKSIFLGLEGVPYFV